MRLKLRKNQSSFPAEVFQETNLKILEVVGDGLSQVPSEIAKLTALENFSLQAAQVSELPKELFELPNLKILKIKGCPLTSLPNANVTRSLEKVQLAQTGLAELPTWFANLENLLELDLTNNNLTTLPTGFEKLTKLRRLVIDNNSLSKLPSALYNMPSLKHLSLDGNPFSEEEKELITEKLGIWF